MILKQHLDIDGTAFDISIRRPPPVDDAGGKTLDKWMRVIIGALEAEAGEPFEWEGKATEATDDRTCCGSCEYYECGYELHDLPYCSKGSSDHHGHILSEGHRSCDQYLRSDMLYTPRGTDDE